MRAGSPSCSSAARQVANLRLGQLRRANVTERLLGRSRSTSNRCHLWITRKKSCFKLPVKLALYPYQSRDFGRRPITSGLALETDIVGAGRYVSKVPDIVRDGYSESAVAIRQRGQAMTGLFSPGP